MHMIIMIVNNYMEKSTWVKQQPFLYRWQGVPCPGPFHWSEDVIDVPWKLSTKPLQVSRPYKVVFWGSMKTWYNAATKIRTFLVQHCLDREGDCWVLEPSNRINDPCQGINQTECVPAILRTKNNSDANNNHNSSNNPKIPPPTVRGAALYRQAIFCLRPPGDC